MYRDKIEKLNSWIVLGMVVIEIAVYYAVDGNAMMCLLVSAGLLIYAVAISSENLGGYYRTESLDLSVA